MTFPGFKNTCCIAWQLALAVNVTQFSIIREECLSERVPALDGACVSVCDWFSHLMWANWAHRGHHYPLEPRQVVLKCVRVDEWSWAQQASEHACTYSVCATDCGDDVWCNTLSETPAFVCTPSQQWWTRTGNCELKETSSLLRYFSLDYFIVVTERKWNTSCPKVLSGLTPIYNSI